MKKYKNYVLAFLFPFIICIIFLYLKGVFQDIERIFVYDLQCQHFSFLSYYKGIMLGRESLAYSYYAGMGSPMLATMIFYCVSPFNILLLLISDIQYAILFIIIGKVSLAGLTMYIFLHHKFNRDNFIIVMFSTCYAISSYVINFWFCGFWFDSVYLAPLVMLGIEKMYHRQKINYLYIFSLALAIICNIQMGFSLCIYSVIYFLYLYNIKNKRRNFKKLLFIFIISSLCVGGISSGVLLSFLTEYNNIATARGIGSAGITASRDIGYIFKNLLTIGKMNKSLVVNYEAYIYCGLIVTYFSCIYFFNKKINKRKKVHSFIVIMIFIFSFFISFLNNFWHISPPFILNYRYSIYLSLFLTMLGCESYLRKRRLSKGDIKVLIGCLIVGLLCTRIYDDVYTMYTIVFLVGIFILIYIVKNKNRKFEMLLCVGVIIEITFNAYLSITTYDKEVYSKSTTYHNMLKLVNRNHFSDDYRIMYNYKYTDFTNDTLLFHNNSSLRYFSSVINGNLVRFFNRNMSWAGMNSYVVSAYESPLLLSLMGNKYFYLTSKLDNGLYKLIDEVTVSGYDKGKNKIVKNKVYLYENPYALSIGYMIDKDTKYNKNMNVVDYQNKIISSFTGKSYDVMIPLEYSYQEQDSSLCGFRYSGYCVDYLVDNQQVDSLVIINKPYMDFKVPTDYTYYYDSNATILIPSSSEDIKIRILSDEKRADYFMASTYDKYKLVDSLRTLQDNMLYHVKMSKNVMTGDIDSKRDGILFLSIPYDDKFKIYVDGKRVKYYSLLDNTFIGLNLEKGRHKIRLKYDIGDSYYMYILSSFVSFIITIVIRNFINKRYLVGD